MAKKFLTPIGLPSGTVNPETASQGEMFYRSDLDTVFTFNGLDWVAQRSLDIIEALAEFSLLEEQGSSNSIDGGVPSTTFGATLSGGDPSSF